MAGFDGQTDPVVEGLRAIALQKVNAALLADLGRNAIEKTHPYPIVPGLLPAQQLPAMAIFASKRSVVPHGQKVFRRGTYTFNYFAPQTPIHDLGKRWPLLYDVFEELQHAIRAGRWTDSGDAARDLITDADVIEVRGNTMAVEFSFAPSGDLVTPFFSASIEIDSDPRPQDNTALEDFDAIDADFNLEGLGSENPIVSAVYGEPLPTP